VTSSVSDRVGYERFARLPEALVSRSGFVWALVIGGAAFAGVAIRARILAGPLGMADADEAVGGLMARHVLDGDVNVFFWLSYYAGTQEVLLTAPVFAAFGSGVVALKAVPVALYAAAAVTTWRIGVRTVGEPAARVAGALMWVFPPFFVYWTTKRSSYPTALLCGVLVVLLALRLAERQTRRDAVLLGAAAGCGVWATPQSMLLAAPAIVWLCIRRPQSYRVAAWSAAGFVVGAAPWIAWNATHGFKALLPIDSVEGAQSTYSDRLADLFTIVLPEWFGLRLAYSKDWIVAPPIGAALTLAAVSIAVYAAVRFRREFEPLIAILVAFPFLYAASSFTFFTDEPRYLTFLAPVFALLFGAVASRPPVAAIALAGAVAWTAFYLIRFEDQGRFRFIGQPADLRPLLTLLERERETRVFANYWIAYRITFESREQIVATSTGFVRNADDDALVKSAPSPAYVYVEGSAADRLADAQLERRGYRRLTSGGWAAYVRG
jgi:hypothetical protein